MEQITNIEKLFSSLNDSAEMISKELNISYIEALAETGENIFHGAILQDGLSEVTAKNLMKRYEDFQLDKFSKEEVRKAYQLAILKGLKEGTQPNHQMTPDSIGLFLSYLVSKFVRSKQELSILDPAVGTGNLLTTVLNNLPNEIVESIGIDVDDLLIKLAYMSSNLQEHPIQFFNQDSLEPLLVSPVDVTICDLPVGYYPNDEGAKNYRLKAEEGYSYAHHLFIEQSMNYTKNGGYLFFIVPNSIFSSKEAPSLNEYISSGAYIQAFIQLPLTLFKDEQHAKSILVLQKQGENVHPPKQTMLVQLPKMTDANAMRSVMKKIEDWFKANKI